VILKIVLKASYVIVQYIGEIDQRQQRKAGAEVLMQLSEQSLELVSFFKKASRNSFTRQPKNGKPFVHVQNVPI
jgi:hypothetical protein